MLVLRQGPEAPRALEWEASVASVEPLAAVSETDWAGVEAVEPEAVVLPRQDRG